MANIYAVKVSYVIPVVAESEEEAKKFVLNDADCAHDELDQFLAAQRGYCMEEGPRPADEDEDLRVVISPLSERDVPAWGRTVPWGDDGWETVAQRLETASQADSEDA